MRTLASAARSRTGNPRIAEAAAREVRRGAAGRPPRRDRARCRRLPGGAVQRARRRGSTRLLGGRKLPQCGLGLFADRSGNWVSMPWWLALLALPFVALFWLIVAAARLRGNRDGDLGRATRGTAKG